MEEKDLEGLEGLGVSVQSQETLEHDIIERLEEKIKVKEKEVVVKQVKKELTSLSTKIRENLKRKKHCERQIRSIYKSESSLSSQKTRQISSLLLTTSIFPVQIAKLTGFPNLCGSGLAGSQHSQIPERLFLTKGMIDFTRSTSPVANVIWNFSDLWLLGGLAE